MPNHAPLKSVLADRPIRMVLVQGTNPLLNQLLATYLMTVAGVASTVQPKDEPTPADAAILRLIDVQGCEASQLSGLLKEGPPSEDLYAVALFNADLAMRLEREALALGVRGVFYRSDPPETLAKGVKALLDGELWYSRKVTARLLLERAPEESSDGAWFILTSREREILRQLAAGSTNQAIADALCISLHTVKSHLYNIYRKIQVNNRLQAILWAVRRPRG